ncbi:hypothetical protein O3M35_011580 [Rhynocoris fuscipes]|uniref:GST N-terminal domain-containing protein n=1 Tax=Rhynocoris fuscipes TaxID=488301 RepID=A0AAW1D195_9HEMI
MVLHEKDIKYKTHFVNIASGEQYQDWYLKINPLGEVPVIKDGDTIIVDSQRIIMYLEDKYTGGKIIIIYFVIFLSSECMLELDRCVVCKTAARLCLHL